MNEIEVILIGISNLLKPSTSHALILEEVTNCEGGRRMAMIIGDREATDLRTCMSGYKSPRPLTYDFFNSLLQEAGISIEKAVIYDVNDGVFNTYVYCMRHDGTTFKVDSRPTDALALSFKMGFPVYVLDELLENEKIRLVTTDGSGFSMPLNSVGTDMLKMDLEAAVNSEDYERAAMLRDEISRRKNNDKC